MAKTDRHKQAKAKKAQQKADRRARAEARLAAYETGQRPTPTERQSETSAVVCADRDPHTARQALAEMALQAEKRARAERERAAKQAETIQALAVARGMLDREERLVRQRLDRCLLTWIVLAEEPASDRAMSLRDLYGRVSSARHELGAATVPTSMRAIAMRRKVLRGKLAAAESIAATLDTIAVSASRTPASKERRARYHYLDTELRRQTAGTWPSPWLGDLAAAVIRDLRKRLSMQTYVQPSWMPTPNSWPHTKCTHGTEHGRCQYVTCANHPLGGVSMDAD